MAFEALIEETVGQLEQDFFNKRFYFSYSSLSKLLWNPKVFYDMYVLGLKEEKTEAHIVQGKLIHALLLEPDKIKDQFIISPMNLPTGNVKSLVEKVYVRTELLSQAGIVEPFAAYAQFILEEMKAMNYHQSLKTDQQRLDKVLTPEAQNYFDFLRNKKGKTLVDESSVEFCKAAVEIIKANQELMDTLGLNVTDFDNKEVYHEHPMQHEAPGNFCGLKGIVDNLVIDHDKKTVTINDIKTTGKDLKDFPESVEYFSYWLQAVIYSIMVGELMKDRKLTGYQLQFNFVVTDRTFQSYVFKVSKETMNQWAVRFNELVGKAQWHFENKRFDLPYEFATGAVTL